VKGLPAMAGLYSGKRTRTEHDLAENNDRNKRRNSGTGREQTMPGADSTVYRILCPGNVIGSVIGKGGKVIKSMRQETRSKIRVADAVPGVDERVIVIFSSPLSKDKEKEDDDDNENEPVCPAQDGLLRVHSVIVQESSGKDNDADKKRPQDARLLVANSQIGSLIGKGGNNIQKLRSESGAQIQIPRKDELPGCAFSFDELVVISGDAAAVKKALYAVSAFLFKHPPKEQIPWSVILPETNQSSLPPSGVPTFPPANYLPQGDSLFGHHNLSAPILGYASRLPGLGGYGSEAGSAWPLSNPALPTFSKFGNSAAKKTSEEFSIRVLCPNDKIGGVIGKGGNTIKSMRNDTGASIRVEDAQTESDERVIVVSATELADDRVSPTIEAVLLLQGKTSGTTDKDGAISTRFLVPSKHIGCLLGKGGNIISEMRKQTRANIRIFRKDERPICVSENEELVQVTGEPGVAKDALIEILKRLRENIFKDKDGASNTDSVLPLSSLSVPSAVPLSSSYGTRKYDIVSPRGAIAGRSAAGLSGFGALQAGTGSYASLQPYAPTRTFGIGLSGGHLNSSLAPSHEFAIPNSAVSSVLGRGGSNISHIREISGATVKLRDPITGASDRVVEISGTPEQSHAAQSLIQAFMLTGQSQQSRMTSRTY
jgi:transcription antitermination factor NusA-like protein